MSERENAAFDRWIEEGRRGGDDSNYRPRMKAGFIAGYRAALQPTDAGGEEPTGRLEQPEAPQASPVSTANGGGAAVVTAPTDPLATAINRYAGPVAEIEAPRAGEPEK